MNLLSVFSFILAVVVMGVGLRLASSDLIIFLDYPSMFIVVGGSFAATAIGFKLNRIITLFKIFILRTVKSKPRQLSEVVEQLLVNIDEIRKGKTIQEIKSETNEFFFKDALELIEDGLLKKNEIIEVLGMRKNKMASLYMEDAQKLKSIGKFPPAFGMIGTTIGMIVLLANLGGADAMKMIGPAMGVCLITTLYGAVLANLLLIPMAENLILDTKEVFKKNEIIIEAVTLIIDKASPIFAAEKLNSHLLPGQRVSWKEVLKVAA